MELLKQFLFLGVIITLMTGCKPGETTSTPVPPTTPDTPTTSTEMPNNNLDALVNHTWKLIGITFYEKDQYIERPKDEKGLIVSFKEGGKLNYTLSVNKCMGTYSAEAEALKIEALGACTKMCCDSDFARDFQEVFTGAKSYKIHGEQYLDVNCEEKILKFEKVNE